MAIDLVQLVLRRDAMGDDARRNAKAGGALLWPGAVRPTTDYVQQHAAALFGQDCNSGDEYALCLHRSQATHANDLKRIGRLSKRPWRKSIRVHSHVDGFEFGP